MIDYYDDQPQNYWMKRKNSIWDTDYNNSNNENSKLGFINLTLKDTKLNFNVPGLKIYPDTERIDEEEMTWRR